MSDSAGPLDMTTRRWYVLTAVLVGALLTLGGLVGGLIAKAFADHEAGLRLQTAPCPQSATCMGVGFAAPDYLGLWVGLVVAGLGLGILSVALLAGYARQRRT